MNSSGMPHGQEIEELLVGQMHAALIRPKWWQTFRGRMVILLGFTGLAGAAIGAVVVLESKPVTETTIVHCVEGMYLNTDGSLSGAAVSIATTEGVLQVDDAVSTCREMWLSGAFESSNPLSPTHPPATYIPTKFTVCVADDGYAAVVPGSIECSALGLNPYQPKVPTGR